MDPEGIEYFYTLKSIFNAHDGDVRVLSPISIPDGGILTGSRDSTVKLWAPEGKSFKECHTFSGATNFISSLCVLPPSAQYPKGFILAGSRDCSIYGFTPDVFEPVLRLLGHSNTVCTLSFGNSGFIVSGSWDKTARVWNGQQCVLTLQGHQEAVWATDVFSTQNLILTGSADRTIRLWRQGVCEKVFEGHKDCVRGLAIVTDMKFLSCSNDNTVRLWLTSGDCLHVFQSHTDYVYSITLLSNGLDFATCGEDQTVKIWRNGACIQTFVIGTMTLWDIACLSNGDLAVGTSDGKVYVFEKVPLDHFEKTSESCSKLDIANVQPTCSYVSRSSIYSGETIVTYQNDSGFMYICQYDTTRGVKIRKEVLDLQLINNMYCKRSDQKSDTEHSDSDRKLITDEPPCKKYDYIFDVDVKNAIYKLGFNNGDNPWEVAEKFIIEHNLTPEYIGTIVDYIIKNSVNSFSNTVYPVKNYLYYLNVNIEGLQAKLLEFCCIMPKEKYLSPPEVESLMQLASFPEVVPIEHMGYLNVIISWSDEYIFPVLDLLRLGVRCKGLSSKVGSSIFVNHLLRIFMETKMSVNRVLVEKIFCNMFGMTETEEMLTIYQDKILDCVTSKFSSGEKCIQKAGAALFLNFAIASFRGFKLNMEHYCLSVIEVLNFVDDSDAIYRMLRAVGTVCTRNSLAMSYFRSVNIQEFILKFKHTDQNIDRIVELLQSDF